MSETTRCPTCSGNRDRRLKQLNPGHRAGDGPMYVPCHDDAFHGTPKSLTELARENRAHAISERLRESTRDDTAYGCPAQGRETEVEVARRVFVDATHAMIGRIRINSAAQCGSDFQIALDALIAAERADAVREAVGGMHINGPCECGTTDVIDKSSGPWFDTRCLAARKAAVEGVKRGD